jgi:hypothetical protein
LVTAVKAMMDAYEHRDGGGDRGSGYRWWSGLPGVPVSALRKDLVRERPPGTYSAAPSYMALA